jgi:tetratricopeptide (TPR) repeat protein
MGKHPAMDEHLKDLLVRGREHYQKRELDKAEFLLRQVVEQNDSFADVFNMLGVIAYDRGDLAAAEQCFERATRLNPNYSEALLNLAVAYNDQAKYEAAKAIYQQIRSARARSHDNLDPFVRGKIANMHADLALAYEEAGLPKDAIREMEKATGLCPTFADLRTRLAQLYRDTGDVQRAREQLEAARASNPRYTQARMLLGITLLSLNEVEAAVAEWKSVLEIDPENKSAKMYLRMVETSPRTVRPPPGP